MSRVEFRVDGALVEHRHHSPYSFSATALAAGSHTAQATAFDNATPPLSTATALIPFTVLAAPMGASIIGESGHAESRGWRHRHFERAALGGAHGNVVVTLTRSGSTVITSSPGTVTLTTGNWSTGVNVTFTAAAGTTAATSTFAAAAPNYTGATITVNRTATTTPGTQVDNPYSGAGVYNNPHLARERGGRWRQLDRQPADRRVDGSHQRHRRQQQSGSTGAWGLVQHLNEAVTQDAANGATPLVFQLVIYNLPGRDCAALASNGELGPNDLPRYKAEYIDVIAGILRRPEYAAPAHRDHHRDRLAAESGDQRDQRGRPARRSATRCSQNRGYVNGVGYALATLGAIANVYNYVDAGHHGWLGWDTNFGAVGADDDDRRDGLGLRRPPMVHGFITNTANTSALQEPYITVDSTTRPSRWIDWNQFNDELTFAQAFRNQAVSAGFPSNIGMLIDTSRNGWGGAARPTGPSTLADLNARIDASRIDRRIHKGNWCNPSGAGIGERPRAAPAAGIDAYVWIKPPGESDGSSTPDPERRGQGLRSHVRSDLRRQSAQQQQHDRSAAECAAVGSLVPGAVPAVAAERLSTVVNGPLREGS